MQAYRGTRDFLPHEWAVEKYLFTAWRRVSELYGFDEYEAPIIESLDLFTKKSGDEIKEQLFWFTDKGGRKVALRAELTPQLARLFVQYGKSLKKPLKLFSIPRLFRYERPQKGRLREFFQFNADIIGSNIKATAEIINLSIDVLRSLGLKKNDFVIKINDRGLLNEIANRFNANPEKLFPLLDKRFKISDEEFFSELFNISDSPELRKLLSLSGSEALSYLNNNDFNTSRINELFRLVNKRFVSFDLSIIRGLDYYTGIVFEGFDRDHEFRAILGGGEYSNLISDFGGEKISCVGVGMGDAVIIELLKKKGLIPLFKRKGVFIAVAGDSFSKANQLAKTIRSKGINVFLYTGNGNLSKQLSLANYLGYNKVIIVGEKDLTKERVVVKNLLTGTNKKVKLNVVVNLFK